jgi:glycosyltransferase involved in cell wall biosynthesis
MVPHFGNANPYVNLLRDSLSATGVDVTALITRTVVGSPPKILHYHWPQNVVARKSMAGAIKNAAVTLLRIDWLRRRGTRLVWTAHNLASHASRSRWVEDQFMQQFTRRLDGIIFLDPSLREEALVRFPHLAKTRWKAIPHGVYGAAGSKDAKAQYRRRFGLPRKGAIVGFIGDIHPYKGLGSAIDAFQASSPKLPALLVAGAFSDQTDAIATKRRLDELRQAGADVTLIERRLDDEEMVQAIRACDALLLPYIAGSNSGLAVLSLEAEVPIICSGLPMFISLQAELGGYWVRTMKTWSTDDLVAAMAIARGQSDRAGWRRFVEERQWSSVATKTRDFYRELDEGGR